jgi:hypothetical protein
MSDIENPQDVDNTSSDSNDFSLPAEMFRSVDKEPEAVTITMWKNTNEGIKTENITVDYVEIDGKAIFEGDIVLGDIEEVRAAKEDQPAVEGKGIGIVGEKFRWTRGKIPFVVEEEENLRHKVGLAIEHWEKHTPFRFIPRTPENEAEFPDFISFENNTTCESMVGRRGGKQVISIGDGCSPGAAIHEIGHAIGLFHEQSRSDRDSFVEVIEANIKPFARFNFRKQIQNAQDLGDYDYESIMHYSRDAFSINNQPTIKPLQPGKAIGQRKGLSKGDVESVKKMYSTLNWTKVVPIP